MNTKLLDKVQNESVFKNGKKGSLLTLADAFEDTTDAYLPDLIRPHIKEYLPAMGTRDLHDSSFYDNNGSFIGINTKSRNMATPIMGGCKLKRLYDFLSESEDNHYIFLNYECIEARGKWWVKEVKAMPITFIPVETYSFVSGGWGSCLIQRYEPKGKRYCADGTLDMRNRDVRCKGKPQCGVNWKNPPSRKQWLDKFKKWAIRNYEKQQVLLQKKIDVFEETG